MVTEVTMQGAAKLTTGQHSNLTRILITTDVHNMYMYTTHMYMYIKYFNHVRKLMTFQRIKSISSDTLEHFVDLGKGACNCNLIIAN